jgi:hypothetical protein
MYLKNLGITPMTFDEIYIVEANTEQRGAGKVADTWGTRDAQFR